MPFTIHLAVMADLARHAFEAASKHDPTGFLAAILAAGIIALGQRVAARIMRAWRHRR